MMWTGTSPISESMKCMSLGILMTEKTRQMGSRDTMISGPGWSSVQLSPWYNCTGLKTPSYLLTPLCLGWAQAAGTVNTQSVVWKFSCAIYKFSFIHSFISVIWTRVESKVWSHYCFKCVICLLSIHTTVPHHSSGWDKLWSCVKVDVDVLGSLSLVCMSLWAESSIELYEAELRSCVKSWGHHPAPPILMVSVDVKQHWTWSSSGMFGSANGPQICFAVLPFIVSVISEVFSFAFSLLLFSKTNLTAFLTENPCAVSRWWERQNGAPFLLSSDVPPAARETEPCDLHRAGGQRALVVGHMVNAHGSQTTYSMITYYV